MPDDDRLSDVWDVGRRARAPDPHPRRRIRWRSSTRSTGTTSVSRSSWNIPIGRSPILGSRGSNGSMESLEAIVAAHPRTTFIGAHVGCFAEDLSWVSRMLTAYPNFHIDVAARIAELGRQPRATRRLMLEHPDRVCFGTDDLPTERRGVRDPLPLPRNRRRALPVRASSRSRRRDDGRSRDSSSQIRCCARYTARTPRGSFPG